MTDQTADAREGFIDIVKARLDARIARGETWTTTRDLYHGYEDLHRQGYGSTPPSRTVAAVLNYAEYRDRLFYARNVTTHRAERSEPGRRAPYKIYLRADATPPSGYVLVPMHVRDSSIGEYIAAARGAADATVHRYNAEEHEWPTDRLDTGESTPAGESEPTVGVDFEAVAEKLAEIIKAQADIIDKMVPALSAFLHDGHRLAL